MLGRTWVTFDSSVLGILDGLARARPPDDDNCTTCAGRVRNRRRSSHAPTRSAWATVVVASLLTLGLPSGPAAAGTHGLTLGHTPEIEPIPDSFLPRSARAGRKWSRGRVRPQHSAVLHLRGGSVPWVPYSAGEPDVAAQQQWSREFDRLKSSTTPSRPQQPRFAAAEAHEDEAESLFRRAFFLTHYRLNFVHARQLLERVLALDPRHVPALTTLVLSDSHLYARLLIRLCTDSRLLEC